MKCPACGTEVERNAVYCQHCGERVDMPAGDTSQVADEAASPEPPTPAEPSTAAERFRQSLQSQRSPGNDTENELWSGRYSGKAMIDAWLLCSAGTIVLLGLGAWVSLNDWLSPALCWGIVSVGVVVAWAYPLALLLYRRLSIRYRLTSQRFFHESGILRHVTDRIEVIDMDDITFDQTILQRLVNVGTIHVTSSDRSHPLLDIEGIGDVKRIAAMMDDARRAERIGRGIHIESV